MTRRQFSATVLAATAGLALPSPATRAADKNSFSFVLLGDLHYDKLQHHDLGALSKSKPDDLRQVHEYSTISETIMPQLFKSVRAAIDDAGGGIDFVVQVGDLVEGLCLSDKLALLQDSDALEMLRQANLGIPFLFAKGNHDITGPGAEAAYKEKFYPFLNQERARVAAADKLTNAFYSFEFNDSLFCFFDAYNRASLEWLESVLNRRTARHCFVIVHQPVVPYGARSTWHIYSNQRDKAQRDHLLELLGKHNAFALTGHIHKYNLITRSTPKRGQFLQLAISSVIHSIDIEASNELSGVNDYGPDQIKVEPHFSPSNIEERRKVYEGEAPFVKRFEYADMPGYAVVRVNGPSLTATIYKGASRKVWRTLQLSDLIRV